ncbi:hypothetical protein [Oceanicaulis sp.]|uniref:hypothetical protein n=1 Tax=Oceanicaulis sp. TaxID=1924941 RepID=UPI003D29EB5A
MSDGHPHLQRYTQLMLFYLFVHRLESFHPSNLRISGTPRGRVAAPKYNRWHILMNAPQVWRATMSASIVNFIASIAVMISALALALHFYQFWGFVSFAILPLTLGILLIASTLDQIFWTIQRIHDLGKSWVWAIAPPTGLFSLVILSIAVPLIIGMPIAILICAIGLLFIGVPVWAWYVNLLNSPGMPEANRYGPVPEPVPALPDDIDASA